MLAQSRAACRTVTPLCFAIPPSPLSPPPSDIAAWKSPTSANSWPSAVSLPTVLTPQRQARFQTAAQVIDGSTCDFVSHAIQALRVGSTEQLDALFAAADAKCMARAASWIDPVLWAKRSGAGQHTELHGAHEVPRSREHNQGHIVHRRHDDAVSFRDHVSVHRSSQRRVSIDLDANRA